MPMNDLLTAVQMYDFYLKELQLYLDTHPNCADALAAYNEYNDLRKKAYDMYLEKYGPLIPSQAGGKERFSWVNAPWPWERSDD